MLFIKSLHNQLNISISYQGYYIFIDQSIQNNILCSWCGLIYFVQLRNQYRWNEGQLSFEENYIKLSILSMNTDYIF